MKPHFDIHFIHGPYLGYIAGDDAELRVDFINQATNIVEHSEIVKIGSHIKLDKNYFCNWHIKIYQKEKIVFEEKFNCRHKRVYLAIESEALGDTLAWMPYLEEFRKKHKCKLIVSTVHNYLFADQYKQIDFVQPGEVVDDLYAMYPVGLYYNGDGSINFNNNPRDVKTRSMQQIASDILGLEFIEIKPRLRLDKKIKKEKLITIAIHGSAQAKYWNRENGWQEIVDYVTQKGYQVKLLSQEPDNHMGNKHPTGIIHLERGSLGEVIKELQKSTAFIGIGSGLSWLSWATNTPTILISGFSEKFSEFQNNAYRVSAPAGACSGCFNKVRMQAENWHWCPYYEKTSRQFECSRLITPQAVIEQLDLILAGS